jgi:RES domain
MSSTTSTPAAPSSSARPLSGTCWRLVEAQHRVSTLKLVDTVEEQAALEDLVQDTKPALPPECRQLHYLLATPFRYGAAYPTGSRFRRAGLSEGVFYAAEEPHTAVAELVFWRLLFFAESPATPWPANAAEYTAFSAAYATKKAIDLMRGRYARDKAKWTHVTDYAPCQALADQARAGGVEIIRYLSVRDPQGGLNLALLTGRAFAKARPLSQRTWHIRLSASGAQAVCEQPRARMTFDRSVFAADPRIAALAWERG